MATTYPTSIDSPQTNVDNVDVVLAADVNNVQDSANASQVALGAQPVTGISDTVSYVTGALPAPNVLGGFNGVIVNFPTPAASGTQIGWASIVATQLKSIIGGASYRTQPGVSLATLLNRPYITNGADATLTAETAIGTVINAGALGSRPAAASGNTGWLWHVTADGTAASPNLSIARSTGAAWVNTGFVPFGTPAAGSIIYWDDTNKRWALLSLGTSGQALTAGASAPAWSTLTASGVGAIPASTGTTDGDMLVYNSGAWTRLPLGSSGQVLTNLSGVVSWAAQSGVMITTPALWNGTTWTQFGTIQAAITAASSGQFVIVPPGTYLESITLKAGVVVGELVTGTVTVFGGTAGAPAVTTAADSVLIVDRIASYSSVTGTAEYPVLASHTSGTCYIKARKIDGEFVTATEQVGYGVHVNGAGGTTVLDVDEIEVTSDGSTATVYAIRLQAGTLYLYANRISATGTGTDTACHGVYSYTSTLYSHIDQLLISSSSGSANGFILNDSTSGLTLKRGVVTASGFVEGAAIDGGTADLAITGTLTATGSGGYGVATSGAAALTLRGPGSVSGTTYDLSRASPSTFSIYACQYNPTKTSGTITLLQGDRDTVDVHTCNGRLTLTTAVPVTTADVTAATTVYFTPYKGNQIALYTGSVWKKYSFAELSLSLSGWTAGKNSDIYVYDNAGTLTLERVEWTNDTTRATALTLQDGVYCKTGALTRRYLGTIRTTATTGQTEDSVSKRLVWNHYHPERRFLSVVDATNSWTQGTTATWRQANAAATNKVEVVLGLTHAAVSATVRGLANGDGSHTIAVGVGIDSTSANSAQLTTGGLDGYRMIATAEYRGWPGVGYHAINWLEITSTGTPTWYGDNGLSYVQTGLVAEVWG